MSKMAAEMCRGLMSALNCSSKKYRTRSGLEPRLSQDLARGGRLRVLINNGINVEDGRENVSRIDVGAKLE